MKNFSTIIDAYEKAKLRYQVKEIADDIGTSPANLRNMMRRQQAPGYSPRKRSIYWRKLELWLLEKGFLKHADTAAYVALAKEQQPTHEREQAILALAQTCEDLAHYLRDPRTPPEKRAQVAEQNLALLAYTAQNLSKKLDS